MCQHPETPSDLPKPSPDRFTLTPPGPVRPARADLRVPFGYRDGRMWAAATVLKGIACACECPACGHPLVAKAKDSRVRRAHFAHHRRSGCSGGFETAIHKMAKQLIRDRLEVRLPAWDGDLDMPNPPVLADDAGQYMAGRRVEFPERKAVLQSVRLEEHQTDYIPDIAADDEFGRLFIEIRVTHAVDTDKRLKIQSEGVRLVEIDLSAITLEQAADPKFFADAVIGDPGNRYWLSCPAATEDWRDSMRELKEALRLRNEQLAEKRRLEAEASQQAYLEAGSRLAEAGSSKDRYRSRLRAGHAYALAALPELTSLAAREARLAHFEQRDKDRIALLVGSIGDPEIRRAVLDHHGGAWIYSVHPAVWQAEVYLEFVANRSPGDRFNQRDIVHWMRERFEFEPQLYELFVAQYKARSHARKSGIRKNRISAWFFTDEENELIPNFYDPINTFVAKLAYLRALAYVGGVLGELEVARDA